MDYGHTSIDKWTGEADEDYCYDCQKFVEADMDSKCPICEAPIDDFTSEWGSGDVVKASISDAPSVTSTGDIWDRGSGYTWGGGTTWNRGSGTTMSGMWSTGWGWGGSSESSEYANRLLKHKRHLDSLCKVVDPTVNHTLDFASTRTAYTNMETGRIVIDGTLLKKDDDKLDVVSGLAIHEKLHLIHTKPLTKWETKYAYQHDLDRYQVKLLHSIGNSVEDEYIEKQLATDCAGFVQYIVATKDYYFNEKVKDMLDKPNKNAYLDLMNTLLAFIRYPKNINTDRKRRHAKHIQFFARALKNALNSRENVLKAIETLYVYMNKVAEKMAKDNPDDIEKDVEAKIKELEEALSEDIKGGMFTDEDWKRVKDKAREDIIRKHKRGGMDGLRGIIKHSHDDWVTISGSTDYKKMLKEIDEEVEDEITDLEDSDYHETKLGKSEVIGKSTKVTWRTAMPTESEKERYKRSSKEIKPQTKMLKRKIDLYGDPQRYVIRNQTRGKIDKRVLHRIPMDRKDIFRSDIVMDDKPLDVCLLVDESGSMGSYMDNARKSCIAVKEALEENEKLNLWVMGHTADGMNWHTNPYSTNMTVYKSPKITDRPFAIGSMRARCENRDGNAILAAAGNV